MKKKVIQTNKTLRYKNESRCVCCRPDGAVRTSEGTSYSILLEMYCGNVATIKVLNMNEKGNLI